MAAPVVPDPTFDALYDDTTKCTHPTLDYLYYAERVGAPTPTTGNLMDCPKTITTLTNLATRTPTQIGLIISWTERNEIEIVDFKPASPALWQQVSKHREASGSPPTQNSLTSQGGGEAGLVNCLVSPKPVQLPLSAVTRQ